MGRTGRSGRATASRSWSALAEQAAAQAEREFLLSLEEDTPPQPSAARRAPVAVTERELVYLLEQTARALEPEPPRGTLAPHGAGTMEQSGNAFAGACEASGDGPAATPADEELALPTVVVAPEPPPLPAFVAAPAAEPPPVPPPGRSLDDLLGGFGEPMAASWPEPRAPRAAPRARRELRAARIAVALVALAAIGVVGATWGRQRGRAATARPSGAHVATPPAAPARVEIVSIPAGAAVMIEGREAGRTPLAVVPAVAGASLRIARPGYLTATRLLPAAGQRLVVMLEPGPGTIRVRGTPATARVVLDGRTVGALPATLERVDTTRRHVLEVSAAGHSSLRQVIEPGDEWHARAEGRLLALTVALAPGHAGARRGAHRAHVPAPGREVQPEERPAPSAPPPPPAVPAAPTALKRPSWASQ